MRRTAGIIAVVVALAIPAAAQGVTFGMTTAGNVQSYLVRHYQTSDGENIVWARCAGARNRPHRRSHGRWYYRYFKCREVDDVSRVFGVAVAVGTPGTFGVVEYGCSDQYSNYACPSGLPSL